LKVSSLILDQHGADNDAGVQIAGEIQVEHRAAVKAAPCGLELVDDLHGAHLGSAGQCAGRETRCQRRVAVGVGPQAALQQGDQVHDM